MSNAYKNTPDEMLFFVDKTPLPSCAICMDIIEEKNKTILSCGHIFHTSCFAESILNANNSCPLCRKEICRKAVQLPTLTKIITARFIEQALNEEKGKEYVTEFLKKQKEIMNNYSEEEDPALQEAIRLSMNQ